VAGILAGYFWDNNIHEPINRREVFLISSETAQTENVRFEFDNQITSAVLTITDIKTGHCVVLDSAAISKAPKVARIAAESILREFSRKIGMDWWQ
jgi:hypothetical protein